MQINVNYAKLNLILGLIWILLYLYIVHYKFKFILNQMQENKYFQNGTRYTVLRRKNFELYPIWYIIVVNKSLGVL